MKKERKQLSEKPEPLSESSNGKLVGGFSMSLMAPLFQVLHTEPSNNCKAMNCVGCGSPGDKG